MLQKFINFFRKKDKGLLIGKESESLLSKVYLTQAELNHHVHILGASGFGKTVLLKKILKDQIRKGHGCLFLDLKGDQDTLEELRSYIKSVGREDDFKIFQMSQIDSNCYNPIEEGNATEIRDRIINSFNWSEEFYKSQAMSVLLKLLIVLVELRDKGELFSLACIYDCLTQVDSFKQRLLRLSPKSNERRIAEKLYLELTEKDMKHNLSGFLAQLESLLLTEFGPLLSPDGTSTINLFKATLRKEIIFMFLDSRRYGESAKALARLIIRDLIATSAKIDAVMEKHERKSFVCFIDEFSDIAQEDFTAFIDRARSSKMSLVLSHQDLADLKKVSDTFQERLTANMATTFAFLQNNPDSSEILAKKIGTKSTMKYTERYQRFFGLFKVGMGEYSAREVEEYMVHPNRIKRLRVGECVVIKKYPQSRAYLLKVDEK